MSNEKQLPDNVACLVNFVLGENCCMGTEDECRSELSRRVTDGGGNPKDFAIRMPVDAFASIMAENGYTPKTTFWMDFSIADRFGAKAVGDTYRRAVESWHDNIVFLTELAMVLNHKIWQHYKKDEELAQTYDNLWRGLDAWCVENLTGEDLDYYYRTTD